jgi:hypothetical protein
MSIRHFRRLLAKTLLFAVTIHLLFASDPAYAFFSDRCRVAFLEVIRGLPIARPVDREQVDQLMKRGTPRLTANRLVRDYPDFAKRILNQRYFKWETAYRGINVPVDRFDPAYFKVFKGRNINGSLNDVWVSHEPGIALLYSRTDKDFKWIAGAGTVFEMKVPSFLLEERYEENQDHHLQRKDVPESDLYTTAFVETRTDNVARTDGGKLTLRDPKWRSYEEYYFIRELRQRGYSDDEA